MLAEKRDSVATVMRRAGKELNTDELTSRRDDTSQQDTVTTAAATREAEEGGEEEEEDVAIRVILLRSVNATVSVFN
ncbi:hypothetical protein BDFG_08485 [Blastomyces dermatitidis ATCC 26199]|nr:hypothetical protein BDFG_08485 [Blastomyces dermatitidis ATCC 26199]